MKSDRAIGAFYISRTPLNLGKFLYQERNAILTVFGVMFAFATLIGWVLTCLISRPVTGLRDAAQAVAEGYKDQADALLHYGFRKLATLGESVAQMSATLTKRSQEITTYTDHVTHELKSPVTTIVGAAELLQDEHLTEDNRRTLLENIAAEGNRMNRLLEQLREMTRVKAFATGEPGKLSKMLPHIDGLRIDVEADQNALLPLTVEHGRVVLLHLAQNAKVHHATVLRITWEGQTLTVADDGEGLQVEDRDRLSEPFFTTRRETGGTGMGLAICSALLDSYGATLKAIPVTDGATFQIEFEI